MADSSPGSAGALPPLHTFTEEEKKKEKTKQPKKPAGIMGVVT